MARLHPATQQIEGEDFQQERRFVGIEAVGGDLADTEAASSAKTGSMPPHPDWAVPWECAADRNYYR
jgi:hypothetical protein